VNTTRRRCELSFPPLLERGAPTRRESGFQAAELARPMIHGEDVGAVDARVEPLRVVTRQSTDVLAVATRTSRRPLSIIREKACAA